MKIGYPCVRTLHTELSCFGFDVICWRHGFETIGVIGFNVVVAFAVNSLHHNILGQIFETGYGWVVQIDYIVDCGESWDVHLIVRWFPFTSNF